MSWCMWRRWTQKSRTVSRVSFYAYSSQFKIRLWDTSVRHASSVPFASPLLPCLWSWPPGQESEALQSANSLAREILLKQHADGHDGHRVPPAFAAPSRRPHLSLIYGDHPQEERSKIVSWIKELSLSHGGHGGVVTPSKQKHQKKQRCQRCWHANVQKWRVSCLGASGSHISTKYAKAKS